MKILDLKEYVSNFLLNNFKEPKLSIFIDNMFNFLIEKNRKYGNSVLQPINIFNHEKINNGINYRLDDKLNRILNADTLRQNDVIDIIGYLIILFVKNENVDYFNGTIEYNGDQNKIILFSKFDIILGKQLDICLDKIKETEEESYRYIFFALLVMLAIKKEWFIKRGEKYEEL